MSARLGSSLDQRRVVLLDSVGDLRAVVEALAGIGGLAVERAAEMPCGEGIVALLVGSETQVGAHELRGLPDLRIVAATSTGYDHLDLDAIAAAGAWATHCPGYCDEEVAEHAIALALGLLRGVTLLDRAVRRGAWGHEDAPPRRVAGSALGIVGLGRIGRRVAERARALGMRVLACDPMLGDAGEPDGVTLLGLDELLAAAEVVTLHAPLTEDTRGLIGRAELALMRPGSFLVNCSRAALVDQHALGEALCAGHLGGCALDVLAAEPPDAEEPALTWPRTVITPHVAWYSPSAASAPYRLAGQAVRTALSGHEPPGVLARPSGDQDAGGSQAS